jgi:hypothetical protein
MSPTIPHRYRPDPAGWLALCRSDLVLVVDVADTDPRVAGLWDLVDAGARTPKLLDELTRGGISATPSFAMIERAARSGVRVLARGAVRVRLGADAMVDGEGVTGWAESVGKPADAAVVEIGRVAFEGGLPIGHGIVRVAGVATGEPGEQSVAVDTPVAVTPVVETPVVESTVSATTVVETTATVEEDLPVPAQPAAVSGYDHLFGETMYRSVEDAAVRAAEGEDAAAEQIEDRTIVASDLAAARANRRATRRKAEPAPPSTHLYVDLSTGTREALDRTLVIGRAPSAERVSSDNVPRLVSMTTPNQDISRTHVQIAVEGGTVVVTDLHSRNGTMVQLPGKPPQQLRAGEPTPVTVGTVVDLGDGATLTVGEEP